MKRNFLFAAALLPCVLILFSTCVKDVGKPIGTPTTTGGGPTVPTIPDSCKTNIKFATQIQPILNTYCAINTGCHAQNNTWGNFTSYGGFQTRASLALNRVKNLHDMPPDYTLGPKNQDITQCEIAKLEAWIAEGTPNN